MEEAGIKIIRVRGYSKVDGTDTYRSDTHEFLLTFQCNHGPISYRFRVRRRFKSKTAKFSHHRLFYSPADEVTLGVGYQHKGSK